MPSRSHTYTHTHTCTDTYKRNKNEAGTKTDTSQTVTTCANIIVGSLEGSVNTNLFYVVSYDAVEVQCR